MTRLKPKSENGKQKAEIGQSLLTSSPAYFRHADLLKTESVSRNHTFRWNAGREVVLEQHGGRMIDSTVHRGQLQIMPRGQFREIAVGDFIRFLRI